MLVCSIRMYFKSTAAPKSCTLEVIDPLFLIGALLQASPHMLLDETV